MPLKISRKDSLLAAGALRAQAYMRRRSAEQSPPLSGVQVALTREAENYERVAKLLEDHAVTPHHGSDVVKIQSPQF
jgi:hypothetical protein